MSRYTFSRSSTSHVSLVEKKDGLIWYMDGSAGFTVASAQGLIDSKILETSTDSSKCNWCVPSKVNVLL